MGMSGETRQSDAIAMTGKNEQTSERRCPLKTLPIATTDTGTVTAIAVVGVDALDPVGGPGEKRVDRTTPRDTLPENAARVELTSESCDMRSARQKPRKPSSGCHSGVRGQIR
jgi:hypothetical protein